MTPRESAPVDEPVDVVIVTALPLEERAVLDVIEDTEPLRWRGRDLHIARVGHLRVLVWPAAGMGNVGSAAETTHAIGLCQPEHVLLVGIAGGLATAEVDLRLGDVIVPEQVVGYELARVHPDRTESRYETYRPDYQLVLTAKAAAASDWDSAIRTPRPPDSIGEPRPSVHFGPVLSGEKVIAHRPALVEHLRTWPRAMAVEMESVGVALACYRSAARFLMVKSLCDLADEAKGYHWHEYAAEVAARFAVQVLHRLPGTVWRRRRSLPSSPLPPASTAVDSAPQWHQHAVSSHWLPQSQGSSSSSQPAHRFIGRVKAVQHLVDWLAGRLDERPRVVTGDPGSGKSALLAWLFMRGTSKYRQQVPGDDEHPDPPTDAITAAVHARDRSLSEVTAIIGFQVGYPGDDPEKLIEHLTDAQQPVGIVIDALDESPDPHAIIAKLARPLAHSDTRRVARLLLGVRRHLANRLRSFTETVDLDDEYADAEGLRRYVHGIILGEGQATLTPYHGLTDRAWRVADAVARNAKCSFLIGQLVARALAARAEPAEVIDQFPGSVREAMEIYLDTVSNRRRVVEDLLRPLAYAEGLGLPPDLWATLAGQLAGVPGRYSLADIDELFDSPVASLLTIAASGDEYGPNAPSRSLYRLFHEALDECLRQVPAPNPEAPRDEAQTRAEFAITLVEAVHPAGETGPVWRDAHPYIQRHLASHAAGTPVLDQISTDPGFLLVSDQDRLLAALHAVRADAAVRARTAYQFVARNLRLETEWSARAAYLTVGSMRAGAAPILERLTAFSRGAAWWPVSILWRSLTAHRILDRGNAFLNSIATASVFGEPFVVTGSEDGLVRFSSLTQSRAQVRATDIGVAVRSMDTAELDGLPFLAAGGEDGRVYILDLPSADVISRGDSRHQGPISALVCLNAPDGPVVVTGARGEIFCWSVFPCTRLLPAVTVGTAEISDLAAYRDGTTTALVICGGDGRVHLWAPDQPAPHLLFTGQPFALAVATFSSIGDDLVVTGHNDGSIRVWNIRARKAVSTYTVQETYVGVMTTAEVDGHRLVLTGGEDGDIRLVDIDTGSLRAKLIGHTSAINAITTTQLSGRPVALSAGEDDAVRLWDISVDHSGSSADNRRWSASRLTEFRSTAVALGVDDATVTLFDAQSGMLLADRDFTQLDSDVTSVAIRPVGSRILVAAGTEHGTVAVAELTSRTPEVIIAAHTDWVAAVKFVGPNEAPVLLTVSHDSTASLWDPTAGTHFDPRIDISSLRGKVTAVAVALWDDEPTAVLGSASGHIQALGLVSRHAQSPGLSVGPGAIGELTPLPDPGHVVLGMSTGELMICDLIAGTLLATLPPTHTQKITAIAVGKLHGEQVLISGSAEGLLCIWEPIAGLRRTTIDVDSEVKDIAIRLENNIVVATSHGVITVKIADR